MQLSQTVLVFFVVLLNWLEEGVHTAIAYVCQDLGDTTSGDFTATSLTWIICMSA